MADNQLLTMVNYIERENGVDREIVLTAIEQAIQQAARRNLSVTNDLRVVIDRKEPCLRRFKEYLVFLFTKFIIYPLTQYFLYRFIHITLLVFFKTIGTPKITV